MLVPRESVGDHLPGLRPRGLRIRVTARSQPLLGPGWAERLGMRLRRARQFADGTECCRMTELSIEDWEAAFPGGLGAAPIIPTDVEAIETSRRREVLPDPTRLHPEPIAFPEPEDRGTATLSELGAVEYVEDLIRPGRIIVWAGEEGSGKTFAIQELSTRMAKAGGSFAGSWPITRTGPVLMLSEMHPDDDFTREAMILEALDLERRALSGCYYRLPLASAAGDRPALQVPEWRDWITAWMRERGVLVAVFDTATGAAQVDPWGSDIQAVYRSLRTMTEQYPELAIVLVVHLKKPQGRGERRISDVLGEWGRWCDVLLLLEREGETRVKLTARKRVRHERRIVATTRDGLLVDPQDTTEGSGPKVPLEQVIKAVRAEPGLSIRALAQRLGVARGTARAYIDKVPNLVLVPGNRGSLTCHLSDGVNEGTDTLLPPEKATDVSPVTPSIERGVTDMSRREVLDS